MAKYNVTFSCGHEETVELFGKETERRRKIDYFERYGLCKECYKAQRGIELHVIKFKSNGIVKVYTYYDGSTYEHKDTIKKLGYQYGLLDEKKVWYKEAKNQYDLQDAVSNAKAINSNAKTFVDDDKLVHSVMSSKYQDKNNAEAETKQETAEPKKIEKPSIIEGKYWNKKIYGKAGSYNIYLNNKKVSITDTQKEELDTYVASL